MKIELFLIFNQVKDYLLIDMIAYQCLIRVLVYPAYETKSDIVFVVGQLSYHNSDPHVGNICIAKQTFRYLKEKSTMKII